MNRRRLLKSIGVASALATLIATPIRLWASIRDGFTAETVADALVAVTKGMPVEESDAIKFKIPDIAENGAVVPVSVSTDIPNVRAISIVIENNPNPLTSRFDISPETLPDVSTRVKMGESSMVRVYIETPDKLFTTAKEVKVTIGGCGG
jgi:sulfur-oxidizing protein SoxY